jgi:acyl-CoA hydrolase
MSEINFIAPAYQGDVVEVGIALKRVGKTSVTLEAVVRDLTTQKEIVKIDEIVFVCLDDNGHPTRHELSK